MQKFYRSPSLLLVCALLPALLPLPCAHAKKKKTPSTNLHVLDAGNWSLTWRAGEASLNPSSWTTTLTVSGKSVQMQSTYSGAQTPPGGSTRSGRSKIKDAGEIKSLLKNAESATGFDPAPPQLQETTFEEACLKRSGKTRCATRLGAQAGTAAFDILKVLKAALARGLPTIP